jgi:DNA-binding XRE family transcriptional regulator
MPRANNTPQTKVIQSAREVPEWAQKVKSLREEAGNTQLDLQKAMHLKVNTMSLIETGRRQFSEEERKLFFELIGQPEDMSIPAKAHDLKPSTPKKAAKPAKAESKQNTKDAKPTKSARPAKASKAGKAPKGSKAAAPTHQRAKAAKAPASPSAQPEPRSRRSRQQPVVPAPAVAPQLEEKTVTAAVPKRAGKASTRKPAEAVSAPSAPTQPMPVGPAKGVLSPVKEAVLRDIIRILSNPGLSDNHAKRLHGLFTSLAVNALLGE